MKRTVAVAVATVGVGLALTHAIGPARDVATPQARNTESARQCGEGRRRELASYRLPTPAPAGGAVASETLARDAEKSLLRDLVP